MKTLRIVQIKETRDFDVFVDDQRSYVIQSKVNDSRTYVYSYASRYEPEFITKTVNTAISCIFNRVFGDI